MKKFIDLFLVKKHTHLIKLKKKYTMNILNTKNIIFFLTVNGKVIESEKTLEENGIKDGNIIIVNINDE